jgi:hypothetical protein
VRLLDARQKVVAEGRINADGEWSWPVLKAGAYEVFVDRGPEENDKLTVPVSVQAALDEPPAPSEIKAPHCPPPSAEPPGPADEARFPWLPAGVALGLAGTSGVLFWRGRGRTCRREP